MDFCCGGAIISRRAISLSGVPPATPAANSYVGELQAVTYADGLNNGIRIGCVDSPALVLRSDGSAVIQGTLDVDVGQSYQLPMIASGFVHLGAALDRMAAQAAQSQSALSYFRSALLTIGDDQ